MMKPDHLTDEASWFVKVSTYDYNARLFLCDRHMLAVIDEPTMHVAEHEKLGPEVRYSCTLCVEQDRRGS